MAKQQTVIPSEVYLEQVSEQIRNKEYSLNSLILEHTKPNRSNQEKRDVD